MTAEESEKELLGRPWNEKFLVENWTTKKKVCIIDKRIKNGNINKEKDKLCNEKRMIFLPIHRVLNGGENF